MTSSAASHVHHVRLWIAFYKSQGFTESQSEILAAQVCAGYGRGCRFEGDEVYVFRKGSKNLPVNCASPIMPVSLRDIACAMSRSR